MRSVSSDQQYRAEFDAVVTFANGGGLTAEGFRVDLPGPDVGPEQVAALFAASLGLLMTGGSDFHGDPAHGMRPGTVTLPAAEWERLGAARRRHVER